MVVLVDGVVLVVMAIWIADGGISGWCSVSGDGYMDS